LTDKNKEVKKTRGHEAELAGVGRTNESSIWTEQDNIANHQSVQLQKNNF